MEFILTFITNIDFIKNELTLKGEKKLKFLEKDPTEFNIKLASSEFRKGSFKDLKFKLIAPSVTSLRKPILLFLFLLTVHTSADLLSISL